MKVGDEVTADAWTVGIGAEYFFNVRSIGLVPHVGIRWTRLDVDGYTSAFKTEDDKMDVFTASIGVAFAGNFNADSWKIAPMLDLSLVPNFGDDRFDNAFILRTRYVWKLDENPEEKQSSNSVDN